MQSIDLQSPAKINYYLSVLSRRADNYHNLCSLVFKIDFFDHLTISKKNAGGINIKCNNPRMPVDGRNLVWKAVSALESKLGAQFNISIKLHKNIPIMAGLGGGSSNAASTLLGLNQLYDLGLHVNELIDIAGSIGADVSLFLYDSNCIIEGIGEKVREVGLRMEKALVLLLLPFGASTKRVYSELSQSDFMAEDGLGPIESFEKGVLFNSLEKPAFRLYPRLKEVKDFLNENGFGQSLMSGSGSSFFVITEDFQKLSSLLSSTSGFKNIKPIKVKVIN